MKDYKFDDENDAPWLDLKTVLLAAGIGLGFLAGALAFLSW